MNAIRFDLKQMFLITVAVLALSACDRGAKTDLIHTDTVESLAADPERLRELMRQCKLERAGIDDVRSSALCQTVSEAYRKRFMGDGKSSYGSSPYDPPPVLPAPATSVTKS